MGDRRFEERVKRIEARHAAGTQIELLAGVCEDRAPRTAVAERRYGDRGASFILILLGAATGFVAADLLRGSRDIGLPALVSSELLNFAQDNPLVAAVGCVLTLSMVLSLTNVQRLRVKSVSAASVGAALGTVLRVIA